MTERKRAFYFLAILLILAIVSLTVFQLTKQRSQENATPTVFDTTHLVGGFTIDTPARTMNAATNGVQVTFEYGQPTAEDSVLGQKLQSLNMKVIDGYISSMLHYYECHRTEELMPYLVGPGQYCKEDSDPSLTNANVLLAMIAAHLKQEKGNQLIMGYWVLDDWVQWDAGSAGRLLVKIHNLIQQYTPGRPAICGFGGSIGRNQGYQWADWLADNFTPQGCDAVGLYIYTPSLPNTTPAASPDAYNWSMSGILPAMFASLQQEGWNIKKEPLIGIGQAFGGPIATDNYWVTPSAKDIEIQSKSFCEHGATGLTFYAWDISGFGPMTQTPMNSPEIQMGIHNGIAACNSQWNSR